MAQPDRNEKGQFVKGHSVIGKPFKKGEGYWLGKKRKPFSKEHRRKLGLVNKGGNSTSFKKGHIPWDKGKARPEIQSWLKDFQFQKGNVPHNAGKLFLKIRGEKHWNWRGGVTPENMRVRKSLSVKLWRNNVLERDNWTCQICGTRGGELRANHIKKFADYPKLRLEKNNGITICRDCDIEMVLRHEEEWESYFNFNLETRRMS